jgi:osmotically-inducible protein OsmY
VSAAGPPRDEKSSASATLQQEQALVDAVYAALRSTGHPHLRDLEIEVSNGVIVLWGRVATFYQKQLAQVSVQKVHGVRGVANGLEVICQRARNRELS